MSPRGTDLLERVRVIFGELIDLEKVAPSDVNQITAAMVAHIRTWNPMAMTVAAQEGTDVPR